MQDLPYLMVSEVKESQKTHSAYKQDDSVSASGCILVECQ